MNLNKFFFSTILITSTISSFQSNAIPRYLLPDTYQCQPLTTSSLTKAQGIAGLTSAVAQTAIIKCGNKSYAIGIDKTENSKQYNILKINFSGDINFANCPSFPLKFNGEQLTYNGTVKHTIDKKEIEATISVSIYINPNRDMMPRIPEDSISLAIKREVNTTCSLNEASVQVKLTDTNHSFSVTDTLKTEQHENRIDIIQYPDWFFISLGNNKYICGFYEQPFNYQDNWYKLVQANDSSYSCIPIKNIKKGFMKPEKGITDGIVVSPTNIYKLDPNLKRVYLPAGKYNLQKVIIKKEQFGKAHMMIYNNFHPTAMLTIRNGRTYKIKAGAPLLTSVTAENYSDNAQRYVKFAGKITDYEGRNIDRLIDEDGDKVYRTLKVKNSKGEVVYSAELANSTKCEHIWKVPNTIEGKVTISISADIDSFKNKIKTLKFVVPPFIELRHHTPVIISTTFPEHKGHKVDFAFDNFGEESFFWAEKSPVKDDHFTLTLRKPTIYKELTFVTGDKKGNDILENGILEVCYEGEEFTTSTKLIVGIASIQLANKPLKAFRIRCTKKQIKWLRIANIILQ